MANDVTELSAVAGDRMECTLDMFVHRCEIHICEEQSQPLPDNSLIATLCDAVRLAREYAARGNPERELAKIRSESGDEACERARTAALDDAIREVERLRDSYGSPGTPISRSVLVPAPEIYELVRATLVRLREG